MTGASSVSIEGIRKAFDSVEILKNISFDIDEGEFVVLVGPSGCGKSTLLRTIAGLEPSSGGAIRIGDTVVNNLEPKERDIAMVFQSYALYPHMSVRDNMAFSLRLQKTPEAQRHTRVEEAARILGLEQLLDRFPRELSGGQRQRVAMGRAIVRDPKVFLFDEPLSNLDAKLRVQMRGEIRELQRRLETTTIYVTHDQVEAMTMADRIVVMRDGVVEQIGTPLEVYDQPANTFVAGFIGSPSMNFIQGQSGNGQFTFTDGQTVGIASGERPGVLLGIRPEHLRRDDAGFDVTVKFTEQTGSETMVVGQAGSQTLTALLHQRLHLNHGDSIRLSFDPAMAHVFDTNGVRVG